MTLKVINLEFINTMPGGISSAEDRAVVLDIDRTEFHPITGQCQPVCVYAGTLAGAHQFVNRLAAQVPVSVRS